MQCLRETLLCLEWKRIQRNQRVPRPFVRAAAYAAADPDFVLAKGWTLEDLEKDKTLLAFALSRSCVFNCTGIALAVGGPKFSQMLGSFRYDDPNIVGQLFYGSLALLGILAGIAFGIFLIPYGFGPIFGPFLFKVWEAFGRLEEIQAKCIVIIFEAYDSNEGMFYPVFTYRGLEGIQYWRGPKNYKIGDYQPGAYYPIYRHRRTKRIYLRPKWVEVVNVPFAILRFVLLGGFLLIVLLTCMAMLGGVIVSL